MKTPKTHKSERRLRRFGFFLAATFCFARALQANPIELPERPVTPEISVLTTFAILLEALCVVFLLRRFRRPRFFVLWILGMHLITFPAFLGLLWLLQDMRPAFAVALAEGAVVIVEGTVIFLICRFAPALKTELPGPSLERSWLASLFGNGCSMIAFPLLIALYNFIFQH